MKKEINISQLPEADLSSASLNGNMQLRSEMAQEIISRKPAGFEKWALLIFLSVLLVIIVITGFIRYPDIIEGAALLTGKNAPKEVVTRFGGRLTGLFVENNEVVKANQVLGWIEGAADPREVLRLSENLDKAAKLLADDHLEELSGLFIHRVENLGELQGGYQTFITAWQQFNDYLVNGFFVKRKDMLLRDIGSLQHIRQKTVEQKEIRIEDNKLAKKTFEMNELLYREKIISEEEYRTAQSSYMNKLAAIPQLEATVSSQDNMIRDKQKEINQLEHDILQQQKLFEQALFTLKSAAEDWIIRFVLRSPVDGKVAFVLPLQENQFMEQGKLVAYVTPEDAGYYAEVKLAQHNFGRVDTGMKVQLRFDAFPYQEAGFIPGKLDYISGMAIDSGFLGRVDLPSLTTSRNKEIPFKNGLKARALVITRDMSLLQRIYYGITRSLEMNK